MTSENFDNLCDQIYSQLHNKLERNHDPYFQFATNGTAERVLHHDNLTRLFLCLPAAGHTVVQQFGLTEEELAARVDERQLHSFLAVLIYGCCGIEAARIFTRKLVATNEWPLLGNTSGKRIELLPASRLDLLDIFRDTVIVTKFCGSQACFSTVTILKRQEISIESLASQRLPYLEEHEIGSGDFGRVFRVKIAKGHFKDARRGTLNETPMDVARKDYITTNEFGDEERKTIEKIFNGSNRKCANILGNYGSIRIGVSAYSLFMPCAICDLRAYMTIHHPKGPNTTLEKAEMILSAQGIAEGLDFLHNEMKTADQEDMVCYHMDLKPSNILVFLDTAYDGGTRYVWKLSDFGMARVKIRKRGQTVEQNFNKSFLHRSQPEPEQSVSRTVNRRGQGTYLPPESLKKTPTMTTSSDVWALGCVLSVVFAYLEDGIEGVNDYQTKRLHHPESEGYDRFFLRGHHFRSSKEHPEVHKWHHYLIKKAAHRQAEEEHAVKYMLAYLEEKVLVIDDKKRDNVKIVKRRLAETYSLFKKMAPVEGSTTADGNDHPRWIDRILPIRPRNAPHSNSQVESWQLSEVEGLKGCEISPKGTLVAYWSDIKIKLYNELSLSRKEPPTIDPYAEYTLELADCIWKSVALSEKYLIASTTGANFQCYIYDVVLNRQYHIILQRPEIVTLAISADSKTLACVMQSKEEGQECGSVFLVSILDLIRGVSPCQSDSTTLPLDWPATYITHISFPTPDEVYLVVQPQITARSRENEISMVRLSLKTRQMQTVRIQSQGVDPGNTVGLFTAFTTFRQQPATWAFITRQKQLHIQDLSKPRNNDIANPIRNYRVLKLVMDSNDKKIFALGTHSGNNRVHLLEMTVPQSENDKVCVKELLSLPDLSYDDEFTQVLSYSPHASGEKYILIAALTTASPRWIYRIPLPDSSTVS